jgi:hypothetical protein
MLPRLVAFGLSLFVIPWIQEAPEGRTTNPAPAAPPTAPRKFALLIGVHDYPPQGMGAFQRIFGAANDVAALDGVLTSEFQFASEDVHVLVNREATLARVLGEFESWLIPSVKPNDVVFLYFSGHGSIVKDYAPRDAKTEWIGDTSYVLWDSRLDDAQGRHDLTDDQLLSLMTPLIDRGAHVCVVTDACHSAGGTRGAPRRKTPIRMAPEGKFGVSIKTLPKAWPKSVPFLEDDDPRRPPSDRYVHLAACRKYEGAQEWDQDLEGTKFSRGVFSMLLVETLREVAKQPGTWTYRDLYSGVMWRLAGYRQHLDQDQNPVPAGNLQQRVFAGAYRRPPGRFVATRLVSNRIDIDAGSIAGIEIGVQLEVFDRSGTRIGIAVIDRCDPAACSGTLVESESIPVDGTVYADWYGAPPSLGRIVIRDPTGVAKALVGDLECITFDDSPQYLALSGSLDAPATSDRLLITAPDGHVIVDQDLRFKDDAARAAAREFVVDKLRQEISYQQLVRVIGRHSDVRSEIALHDPTRTELEKVIREPSPIPLNARRNGLEHVFEVSHDPRSGNTQVGTIEVRNNDDEPLFVYVIAMTPKHERLQIYPNPNQEAEAEVPLEPNAPPRRVYFAIEIPSDWPSTTPFNEQYLVLTSTKWINVKALLNDDKTRGADEDADVPPFLRDALRGETMRGGIANEVKTRVGTQGFRLSIRVPESK